METRDVAGDVWPEAIFQASILPPTRGPASPLFFLQGQHTPFPLPEVLLLPSVSNRFFSHYPGLCGKTSTSQNFLPRRLHLQKGLHSEGLFPRKLPFRNIDSEVCSPQEFFLLRKSFCSRQKPLQKDIQRGKASLEGLFKNGYLLMPSPQRSHLLGVSPWRRPPPPQKTSSERPLKRIFSKCPPVRKASSVPSPQRMLPPQRKLPPPQPPPSSSSEEHLIRKDSSQPGFLFRTFQGSLILEACP